MHNLARSSDGRNLWTVRRTFRDYADLHDESEVRAILNQRPPDSREEVEIGLQAWADGQPPERPAAPPHDAVRVSALDSEPPALLSRHSAVRCCGGGLRKGSPLCVQPGNAGAASGLLRARENAGLTQGLGLARRIRRRVDPGVAPRVGGSPRATNGRPLRGLRGQPDFARRGPAGHTGRGPHAGALTNLAVTDVCHRVCTQKPPGLAGQGG